MTAEGEQHLGQEMQHSGFYRYGMALVACLLVCLIYYFFVVATARVEVEVEVSQTTNFKIYWASPDGGYSEAKAASVRVHPGKRDYSFYLTNLSRVGRLRIDTQEYAGEAILKKLVIHQAGYKPIEFSPENGFSGMQPLSQVEASQIDANGLLIKSSGEDANFEYIFTATPEAASPTELILRFVFVAAATLVVIYYCAPLVRNTAIVPVLLFAAWVLIFAMAGMSKQNAHPDEYVHIAAVSYYTDHWMVPRIDDPEIQGSYSVYGVSRLNSHEIYYFVAGKVCRAMELLGLPEPFVFRGLNVLLFGMIFFLSIGSPYVRFAALPFLVSPQIWYTFSSCGSDAFALFFTFLAACQVVDPQSLLHRFLKGEGGWQQLLGYVLLPLMLGVIFLVKKNYYPFLGLFFLLLCVQLLFTAEYYWERKDAIRRVLVICLLGVCVAGLRVGQSYVVNGSDLSGKRLAMAEKYGDYQYRSSTPIEEQHPFIHLKDRGIPLKDMTNRFHWGQKTFQSAFGAFGYLSIRSPKHYYTLVQWAGVALLAFIFVSTLVRGGYVGFGVAAVGGALSVALIGFSLYHSWVDDFQAQGRYLLPIVSMMSIVVGFNMKAFNKQFLMLLVSSMYLLSLYSFIFQGLHKIPKIPF